MGLEKSMQEFIRKRKKESKYGEFIEPMVQEIKLAFIAGYKHRNRMLLSTMSHPEELILQLTQMEMWRLELLTLVCNTLDVPLNKITTPQKNKNKTGQGRKKGQDTAITDAKAVYCLLAHEYGLGSSTQIGNTIKAPHSTVLSSIKRARQILEIQKKYKIVQKKLIELEWRGE